MNRAGEHNSRRFPYKCDDDGRYYCRVCSKPLEGRKSSFCGQRCLRDFFMRTDWQRVRRVIYERDGGICMKCGKRVQKGDYHVDHIMPLAAGGDEWDLGNLELSCPECNLKKGASYEP